LSPEIATGLSAGTNIAGIGVALDFDAKTRTVRITKVIPDSPASESGLSPGLIVQRIDRVATADKSLTECVGRIRGKPGTKIRLELVRSKTKCNESGRINETENPDVKILPSA
jgi:carboxyl-terminal processing protease